jgi:hypothetical protein
MMVGGICGTKVTWFLGRIWYNVNGSGSHLMFSTLKPIPHHLTYALTKPKSITITFCPICNCRFHCKDIIVASCGCTYHTWCLGFHMKMFHQCGQPTYGARFDFKWVTSMGFMITQNILKALPFRSNFMDPLLDLFSITSIGIYFDVISIFF